MSVDDLKRRAAMNALVVFMFMMGAWFGTAAGLGKAAIFIAVMAVVRLGFDVLAWWMDARVERRGRR